MSDSRARTGPAPSDTRPTWIAVGVLLAVGIVVPLLVWFYDTETPELGGFPFFYWFQFLLIPIGPDVHRVQAERVGHRP